MSPDIIVIIDALHINGKSLMIPFDPILNNWKNFRALFILIEHH